MATQDFETLRARAQALADLPALLKPFTVDGTKLRLPKEIGDPLCDVVEQLRPVLGSVHYEGVDYEYQNEPAEGRDLLLTAGKPFGEALETLREARAMVDVINAGAEDASSESVGVVSLMLWKKLGETEKHLNAVWVSIGGQSAPGYVRPDGSVDTGGGE